MKVSNRFSSNFLAGLVSAAVLVGSSFGVAHAEGGAERLIDLHGKSVESREGSTSLIGSSAGTSLKEYLVEDGSERLRDMLDGKSQLVDDNHNYLAEDGSDRLRDLHRDVGRSALPETGTAA